MIRISDLEFRYDDGEFELSIPRLEIARGERVGVIGPSGSGKTSLLYLIAGIASPLGGRVCTGGVVLTELDDARRREFRIRRIGLVFQEFELLDYLSVLDNVLLPYRITPSLRLDSEARTRAHALAEQVGLADKLSRSPSSLSQGEKQRVAVCRALILEPELILADEPTGNLDPANKDRVLDILLDYAEARGSTLVTVTHDHDLLERFGRVIDFKAFGGVASLAGEPPPVASSESRGRRS
jgi:putative ABC transport system ATP-binding protein